MGYRAISGKVALVATPIVRRSGADAAAKGRSQPSRQSPNVLFSPFALLSVVLGVAGKRTRVLIRSL